MRYLLTCLAVLLGPTSLVAQDPIVVNLWPGRAPDETSEVPPELIRDSPKFDRTQTEATESTKLVTNVSQPAITIFKPAPEKDTGTAMLIFPGGGYWNLYWEVEGEEVAKWLTSQGMTGIIVKYRVPRRPGEVKGVPARRPLQDAQRAMSLVRSRAAEWKIKPDRIGVVGFSAGGHLAVATATNFDQRSYVSSDDIDKVSCRPDFAVALYSGYLKVEDKDEMAPGIRVPKETPPIFLAHGGDDIISQPEHSVFMYLMLKRAKVPAELHIYQGSTHGFGVRKSEHLYSNWTEACLKWLKYQHLLEK